MARNFEPGGKARYHRKDLNIGLALAYELNVSLPMTSLVEQLFAALVEKGDGDKNHTALMTVNEALSTKARR
jgi:2-hydroxy-3-oxopropionate reductase